MTEKEEMVMEMGAGLVAIIRELREATKEHDNAGAIATSVEMGDGYIVHIVVCNDVKIVQDMLEVLLKREDVEDVKRLKLGDKKPN